MSDDCAELDELRRHVQQGDARGVDEFLGRHRERLRLVVGLRLDHRLQGRLDASDVVQEAYLEAVTRLPDYLREPRLPPYLWLRFLTVQKLLLLHRHHLQTQARDVALEMPLDPGHSPGVSSDNLALYLSTSGTSPSQAAIRAERQDCLQRALEQLAPLDREILALRHFEQLSNGEAAQVLNIPPGAASLRYFRALRRLKEILAQLPGGHEL